MTRHTTLVDWPALLVTFTSRAEWRRCRSQECRAFGFWRSRQYGAVHVRVAGFEVAVFS